MEAPSAFQFRNGAQDRATHTVLRVSAEITNAASYRPDIDGLRSLAVVAVVLFHAQLGCPGGFVGVDIVFRHIRLFDHEHYRA